MAFIKLTVVNCDYIYFQFDLYFVNPGPPFWQELGIWSELSQLQFLPVHLLDLYQYVLWSIPQSKFRMIAMKKICGIQKAYLLYIIKKTIKDEK